MANTSEEKQSSRVESEVKGDFFILSSTVKDLNVDNSLR